MIADSSRLDLDKRGHIVELQSMRGIAAFIVLADHVLNYYQTPGWFANLTITTSNGQGAVVFFFVLSGFVLGRSLMRKHLLSAEDVTVFYIKRVFRIYPALWTSTALGLIYLYSYHFSVDHPETSEWFQHRFKPERMHGLYIAASIGGALAFVLPQAWTIFVELVGSIIMPLLVRINRRSPSSMVTTTVLLLLASVSVGNMTYYNVVMYLVDFQAGLLIAQYDARIAERYDDKSRWLIVFCVSALTLILFRGLLFDAGLQVATNDALLHVVELICSALAVLAIVAGKLRISVLNRGFLKQLGDASYSLYLVHFPIMCLIAYAMRIYVGSTFGPVAAAVVLLISTSIASFFVASLMYKWIELPGSKLGSVLLFRFGVSRSAKERLV